MKKGDKVRFLSEVGGGTVCGFADGGIVLVEDEDGFEIPMLASQLVLVSEEHDRRAGCDDRKANEKQPEAPRHEEPKRPRFVSKTPAGHATLNLFLSFLPVDVKAFSQTSFETYLVNDSDYHVQVLYMSAEGANWQARFSAEIEPNTKVFVEEFGRSQLSELERLCVQVIAWRPDRVFQIKPALSVELRPDLTKFFKYHLFQPDEFFADPCLTLPVVRDDKPVRSLFRDAAQLQETLLEKDKKPSSIKEILPNRKQGAK
jgi:hypothetical protein